MEEDNIKVAVIVEGYGEIEAIPILIRRIALDINPGFVPFVLYPIRIPFSKLIKEGEIERALELAIGKLNRQGGIIVVADCDYDNGCPAKEGPELLIRAKKICKKIPVSVIPAKKEFETWFIASAESLRGKRSVSEEIQSPENPEDIRGAKEWLNKWLPDRIKYIETEHQPAFTAIFDMSSARKKSNSFDKCYRDIYKILSDLLKS